MAKSKKELYELISTQTAAFLSNNGYEDAIEGVQAVIDAHLKPGVFGVKLDVESVVKRDASGNITELMCSVAHKFLPASTEFFYEDKSGKSKFVGVEGVGLKRLSRGAEGIRKKFIAEQAKKTASINQQLLAGEIDRETAVAALAEIKAEKPDFSSL